MSEPPQASTPPRKPKPIDRPGRPVPVRKLMREESTGESGPPQDRKPSSGSGTISPPTRDSNPREGDASPPSAPSDVRPQEEAVELWLEGESWTVTVAGRVRAGHPGDAGAPLLFLVFARSDAPGEPLREALAPGTDLGRLSSHELGEIFHRARAWSPPRASAAEDQGRGQGGRGGGGARGRGD